MKKKTLGLVMALLTIGSFSAFAQSETSNKTNCTTEQSCTASSEKECKKEGKKKCKENKKECKKNKDCKKKGERVKGEGDQAKKKMQKNPFNGIQLTPDQQQKIDNLRAERKSQKEANKEARKNLTPEERKAAKKQAREQFNAEVAKILTPDQFKQYEENCKKAKEGKKNKVKHASKDGKKIKKGERKIQPKENVVK